jgi:outer membrane protein assembly factor BamB
MEPELLWEFKPEKSSFEATPIIVGNRVYIGDVEGKFYAIDLGNGEAVWQKTWKNGFVVAAAHRDGRIVAGDYDGHIYCFNAADGEVVWEAEINQAIAAGANFYEGLVLLTTESGQMFARDFATGESRWEYATGDQLRSGPTIWDGFAWLGGCDGRLHKIDLKAGTATDDGLSLDGPTGSTPAVLNSIAIVPTQSGQVLAFQLERAERLWMYSDAERSQEIRSSPALITKAAASSDLDGNPSLLAIVTTRNRRVLALNVGNGSLEWEAVLRKRSDSSPVVCDNRVWVGATDGMLYAFDLTTGQQQWSFQLSGQLIASPAISNGRLVVATDKGTVACFGAK